MTIRCLVATLACCGGGEALALTFTQALELARKNDPIYLGAQASFQAAQARSVVAASLLRPQISFVASTARNDRRYVTNSTLFTPQSVQNQQFASNSAQINLTQGLWRQAERIGSSQAQMSERQVESQVLAAEQDVFVRFLQAWLDVMAARDTIHFTTRQSAATRQLRDKAARAAQLGLASEPELEDASARHERALAEHSVAEADAQEKVSAMEQIIGAAPKFDPPSLRNPVDRGDLPERPLDGWLELAEKDNASVVAATFAVRAAGEEVRKQQAGHQPTLDMNASYGRTAQGVGTTPLERGYSNTQASIGLQLNVPIYSGGGHSAKVLEAIAAQARAAQDLEAVRRNVRAACKQAWFGIQSGMARARAASQAVRSASAGIRLATAGRQRELKTDLDVLEATQQLFLAQRDLQAANYLVMLNHIKLRATAGQLTGADLAALDATFVPTVDGPGPIAQATPGYGP